MRMMLLATAALALTACTPPVEETPSASTTATEPAPGHSPEYLDLQRRYADAAPPTLTSVTPTPGVPRSLHITGTAPALWFVERQFPIALADRSGEVLQAFSTRVIEEAPDLDRPVSWEVDLSYAEGETPAMVILEADQAGEYGDEGGPPPPVFRLPLPPVTGQ
jgi:hypothetical protein